MNSTTGYYSLIRYCPDPSRQEFVNVGVAVYSPQTKFVKTAFAPDNRRLSQVFSGQDLRLINRMKKALEEQLLKQSFASASELEAFIARNANQIQLSQLRSIKLTQVSEDLSMLMERLVEEASERRPRLQRALRQKFVEAGVEEMVQKQVSVAIPSFEQSIRVPYAYQNGRYNLISPVEFSSDVRDIFSKAGEKAIEGQELYETIDPSHGKLNLVVVAKFDSTMQEQAREKVKQIFTQHNVVMHSFDNIAPLVEEIRTAAAEHGTNNLSRNPVSDRRLFGPYVYLWRKLVVHFCPCITQFWKTTSPLPSSFAEKTRRSSSLTRSLKTATSSTNSQSRHSSSLYSPGESRSR